MRLFSATVFCWEGGEVGGGWWEERKKIIIRGEKTRPFAYNFCCLIFVAAHLLLLPLLTPGAATVATVATRVRFQHFSICTSHSSHSSRSSLHQLPNFGFSRNFVFPDCAGLMQLNQSWWGNIFHPLFFCVCVCVIIHALFRGREWVGEGGGEGVVFPDFWKFWNWINGGFFWEGVEAEGGRRRRRRRGKGRGGIKRGGGCFSRFTEIDSFVDWWNHSNWVT